MTIVPDEPTADMIEAALISCGLEKAVRAKVMKSLPDLQGGPHEPGICNQLRAVLAVINGCPVSEIKRGFKGRAPAAKKRGAA